MALGPGPSEGPRPSGEAGGNGGDDVPPSPADNGELIMAPEMSAPPAEEPAAGLTSGPPGPSTTFGPADPLAPAVAGNGPIGGSTSTPAPPRGVIAAAPESTLLSPVTAAAEPTSGAVRRSPLSVLLAAILAIVVALMSSRGAAAQAADIVGVLKVDYTEGCPSSVPDSSIIDITQMGSGTSQGDGAAQGFQAALNALSEQQQALDIAAGNAAATAVSDVTSQG